MPRRHPKRPSETFFAQEAEHLRRAFGIGRLSRYRLAVQAGTPAALNDEGSTNRYLYLAGNSGRSAK